MTSQDRWTPHATVASVVERQGRYLLVREHQAGEGLVLNQPAGHIEANESIVQAAIRETLEESGWDITPTDFIGIYTYTAPSNGVTYHRYCFAATPDKHHPDLALDVGIDGIEWLTWDEILAADNLRSPLVRQCIQDHRDGRRFPLDLIYEHP